MREEIPGYREAQTRERIMREGAFLPINEAICGIEVLPMNMLHVLVLSMTDSPFVFDKPPRDKILSVSPKILRDWIFQFLWIVSPHYQMGNTWSWRKIVLRYQVAKLSDQAAVDGILEYLKEAFYDAGQNVPRKSYHSWVAGMVGRLAPKYGTERKILRSPLKCLFQFFNYEAHMRGETLFNPSDAIRAQYRAKMNEERKRNAQPGRNKN